MSTKKAELTGNSASTLPLFFLSHFIHNILHPLCPIGLRFRFIKSLPGYRFTDSDCKCIAFLLKHLIGQIHHFNIKFDAQKFSQIGQIIKEFRVFSFEINRNNIAMMLYRFGNKVLFPFQITDFTFDLTRTHACRKRNQVII